jgi:hypothetical protein
MEEVVVDQQSLEKVEVVVGVRQNSSLVEVVEQQNREMEVVVVVVAVEGKRNLEKAEVVVEAVEQQN